MISRIVVCAFILDVLAHGWTVNRFRSSSYLTKKLAPSMMSEETDVPVVEVAVEGASTELSSSGAKKFVSKERDVSRYSVGEQFDVAVKSAKQFGIFVNIPNGPDVLLPRSVMSKTSFDRLKGLADSKSQDTIKIEILSVNIQNQTISAKYLSTEPTIDFASMDPKELKSKFYNGTILSVHDFGVFVKIDGCDIDGLVPASQLPDRVPGLSLKDQFIPQSRVTVKVSDYNASNQKLTLSMKFSSQDVSVMSSITHDKYVQVVVQRITNFGLFVRPVGYDVSGLLHISQIPRSLVNTLRLRLENDDSKKFVGENRSDVELVFTEGDVLKVRVQSVSVDDNKVEFSMQKYRASDDDEDDYVVEGRETEEELEEAEKVEKYNQNDDGDNYDPEDLLLWWRGAPFVKSQSVDATEKIVDEDLEVVNESVDIVEGTWRRLFEIDLREEEADFTSKAAELDEKEVAEEIGELDGLDDEIVVGAASTGIPLLKPFKAGSWMNLSNLPDEWKSQIQFLKDQDNTEAAKSTRLRSGKRGEKEELSLLLSKMELQATQSSSRRRNYEDTGAQVIAPEAIAVSETMESTNPEPVAPGSDE